MAERAIIRIETMSIPTYPIMDCEQMPMFNENRMHQGTKGNPYPVLPVLSVVRKDCKPQDYEVIRLENDYIRLILIPALGGRIFEAYDKVNDYHFLYRQHVIKPALIGAYGLWISGGLEFNWPFHHRPSTFMPVNYTTETQPDGTVIAWLSECDPTDRTRATIGIVLRPNAAFFETRIQVTNRTSLRHSFLMWQNAAVPVNDDYQFIFPPDVTYAVNHHSVNRAPVTYPIAQGAYAGAYYDEPTDISWYKNCYHATSHFAAPSKYDFFGGYDHGKKCGIIHIADHHVSPGKKMFTWGCGELGANWETALTDEDGRYCELMAGSYSNNQPDFTWLNPYETKTFSEFWYPIGAIGKASFATLEAAVTVTSDALNLQTTSAKKGLHVQLKIDGKPVLDKICDTLPGMPVTLFHPFAEGKCEVLLTDANGACLLAYRQEKPDLLHFPEPLVLNPHPQKIDSVQKLYLQGLHVDQYRHPQIEPDVYYREALRRDPDHIPSLIGLGEYLYRRGHFAQAQKLLERAVKNEHLYNLHYPDGEAEYLLGLTLDAMGETDAAYNQFRAAAWSGLTVARALSKAAAIDGRRGDYAMMLKDASVALESSVRHPLACVYAALAENQLGNTAAAQTLLNRALHLDPLNDLAAYILNALQDDDIGRFWESRRSDASQTALDVAFDLMDAGFYALAEQLLRSVKNPTTPMVGYTLAYAMEKQGKCGATVRQEAAKIATSLCYPYRLMEIDVLSVAIQDSSDATARNLLACELYDKGHHERAIQLWQEACRIVPENAVYLRNQAIGLFSHGNRRDEAIALMEKAISLEPTRNQLKLEYLYAATKHGVPGEKRLEIIDAYPWMGAQTDDYVLEHANALCIAGHYDDALDVMLNHEFVPAEGGERAITNLYFAIMLRKGRQALLEGKPEEALNFFLPLTSELPRNLHAGLWNEAELVPIHYYQGVAFEKLGRREESLEKYRLVLKRFRPEMFEFAFYYAQALRALGRNVEARVFLSQRMRALEDMASLPSIGWEDMTSSFNSFLNNPQQQREGMIAYWKALIYRAEERIEEAQALLETSRCLWPENLNAWIELSLMNDSGE